jgi:hypothetical protein
MAYLYPIGSTATTGVVGVGTNIDVTADGVISIPQNIATTSNVVFAGISAGSLAVSNLAAVGFTATTATITSLTVASEIDTGNFTINGLLASTNTSSNALTLAGGAAISGAVRAGSLYDNNNRVVTSVVPSAGTGIVISNLVSTGTNVSFTVSASGANIINTIGTGTNYTATASDDYIGVTGGSNTTITLPAGTTGTSYIIKNEKTNSSKVTVACTGADQIDGSNTKELAQNASITVVYRAGQWRII